MAADMDNLGVLVLYNGDGAVAGGTQNIPVEAMPSQVACGSHVLVRVYEVEYAKHSPPLPQL